MEILTPQWGLTFWVIISVLVVLFWLTALIDVLRSSFEGTNEKLIWVLVILFAPLVGSILYFAIGRKRRV